MSTAILNVWITNLGDPCTITRHPWVVVVLHCDGRVLNWSEGRYRHHRDDEWTPIPPHTILYGETRGWWYDGVPTLDGHVEIEVPPGCYVLIATQYSYLSDGVLRGNWHTDHAIVQAGCGQDVCATLYAPTEKSCGDVLNHFVIPLLIQHQIIGREEGEQAIEALSAVFDRPGSRFEREEFETLRRAFEQMGKEEEGS